MKSEQFPFLIIEQNKNDQDDESDFSENQKNKRSKKFELKNYEKFKPKNSNAQENAQIYLEGAENKVKSMLSIFLKDIEQENQNIDGLNNKKFINKISQKVVNKFKRNELKRNSVASTNLNFGKIIPKDIKSETSKKMLNKNLITNNFKNINNINNLNSGPSPFFQKNNQKKDIINKNSINKMNNYLINNNYKDFFSPKRNNNIKNKNSWNSSLKESSSSKRNFNINNRINSDDSNIFSDSFSGRESKYQNKNNITNSIIDNNFEPKRYKTGKKSSLKETKNNFIMPNDSKPKNEIKFKRTLSSYSQKQQFGNISSAASRNHIKNNLDKKVKKSIKSDANINDNLNINNINNFKQKLFKEVNINNTFSESSQSIMNQDSREGLTKLESNNSINNNMIKSLSRKGKLTSNKNNQKSGMDNLKNKNNKELNILRRTSTNTSEDKNKYLGTKYLKNNFEFKSIKKRLKKSLILRPEELKSHFKLNNINLKFRSSNNSNSFLSNISKKEKRKSNSITTLIKIDKKNNKLYNLEKINRIDLGSKSKSSTHNIKVLIPKEKKDKKEKKNSDKFSKKDKELKEEVTLKKVQSLKRKSFVPIQKWRIMRRKANIYDSLDDEECEDAEEINHLFINPNSKFILIFDSLIIISAVISFISVPLYLAITHDFCRTKNKFEFYYLTNLSTEFLNIMDLFIGFFRGYYNWEEQLIYRKRKIMIHYIKGWFLFDLISAVPVYFINKLYEPLCNDYELTTVYYNKILNIPHYLFLCNRLLKVYKIFYSNQAYKILSNKINDIVSMIISTCFILISLNYVGCLYIFIGRNCYPNWILNTNLDTSSFIDIYICSMYVLVMAMTTVGYGDITCYSFWEVIFQLFLLIVGIFAYSWVVSSFSNYIKKISEKSADFENKKKILDEIKLSNQNLPDELYEKILRYLKFKNFHEKKLKNIIFDCLPVSLKNNLICEMYKPIIKNFQNTDFIVRVILSFRPILADKNDVLINESDMVEDIMFVRHGILSVEIPINMSNPKENIDKYQNMLVLNEPNIKREGNTNILYSDLNNKLNNNVKNSNFKNTLSFLDLNKANNNLKSATGGFASVLSGSGLNSNFKASTLGNKITISDKEKEKDEIRYVKILCIRENEHFGDVMMFLEQRSPLRIRVKSKKAELYFLKKMDAIKISTSYPNIWRRINKKSVFNFQQIKKSIIKIIELYCSIKKLNSIDEEDSSSTSLYSELINKTKKRNRGTEVNLRTKKLETEINDKNNFKRNHSLFSPSHYSAKKLLRKEKFDRISNKSLEAKISFSSKKVINNLDIDDKIKDFNKNQNQKNYKIKSILSPKNKRNNKNSNNKRVTFDNKLNEVFKENYKFYKKINNNPNDKTNSIIKEDPSNEDIVSRLKSTKSFKNISKISVSQKSLKKVKKEAVKKFNYGNENNEIYQQSKSNTKKHKTNRSINQKSSKKDAKTMKLGESSSSIKLINDENFDLLERSNELNNISFETMINNEIYPGEEIKINKEDNLFQRKVNLSIKSNIYIKELSNSSEKKSKADILKSLDENENTELNKNENNNKILISDKSLNIISNNKKKESSKKILNNKLQPRKQWEKDSLTKLNNISFQLESSYENSNLLCGKKLINNKINQFKLKRFLIEEILNKNIKSRNSFFQLSHKQLIHDNNGILNYKDKDKEIKEFKKIKTSSSFLGKQIKKKNNKYSNLMSSFNKNISPNNIKRTSSFNDINGKRNSFQNHFQNESDHFSETFNNINLSPYKGIKKQNRKILSSNNITFNKNLISSSNEKNRKTINKKYSFKSPFSKPKKKKENLLSKINFNIQKTNQNLNNPDEFYSNYFHSLLEAGASGKNNMFGKSLKSIPRMLKDKSTLKKNFTLKKAIN